MAKPDGIEGMGAVCVKKLVRAFDEKVFDMTESEPDRLREVDGIDHLRAERLVAAWAEQKIVREAESQRFLVA